MNLRVGARLACEYFLSGSPGALRAWTSDIGVGGACIETRSPFAISSLQKLSLPLPEQPLELIFEGCWQRDNPMGRGLLTGLRFVELQQQDMGSLLKFVNGQALELALFLQQSNTLEGAELSDLMELAFHSRIIEVPARSRIYRQGEIGTRGDSLFVLYRGEVSLEVDTGRRAKIQRDRLPVGAMFGGLPILAAVAHTESAIADSDTELFEIDPYTYRYLESTKAHIAKQLARSAFRSYVARFETNEESLVKLVRALESR